MREMEQVLLFKNRETDCVVYFDVSLQKPGSGLSGAAFLDRHVAGIGSADHGRL